MNEQQFFTIIAILVKRLGGEAIINMSDLDEPPAGTVTRDDIARKLTIRVE